MISILYKIIPVKIDEKKLLSHIFFLVAKVPFERSVVLCWQNCNSNDPQSGHDTECAVHAALFYDSEKG